LELLDPYAGMNAIRTYAACHGPVDYYRGRLEALRGRTAAARERLRAARGFAERMGAPLWIERTRAALEQHPTRPSRAGSPPASD
jgi:hypothetical protein